MRKYFTRQRLALSVWSLITLPCMTLCAFSAATASARTTTAEIPATPQTAQNKIDAAPVVSDAVTMAIELQGVTPDAHVPQSFTAEVSIVLTWNPKLRPNFDPGTPEFLNTFGTYQPSIQTRTLAGENGMQHRFYNLQGTFEARNNHHAYPYARLVLPIVFFFPSAPEMANLIAAVPIQLGVSPGLGQDPDNFYLHAAMVTTGQWSDLWNPTQLIGEHPKLNAISLVLETRALTTRDTLMVRLPMFLCWLIAFSALWWKDESACSRAVMSSTFSLIALAIGAHPMGPPVGYMTTGSLSFALVYVNIILLSVTAVIASRAHSRHDDAVYRRIRFHGRVGALVLMVASIVVLIAYTQSVIMPVHLSELKNATPLQVDFHNIQSMEANG